MIYCVVPAELAEELFDKLVTYYSENPDVTVIVDRRRGSDRRNGADSSGRDERRVIRDRRRSRVTGTFPSVEAPAPS